MGKEQGGKIQDRKHMRTVIIFSFLLFPLIVQAQESDQMAKLRLAERFEQAGDWERAVALFEDLYKFEPTNYTYLDGLQRSYAQIKEYDKAIKVIRSWFLTQPKDVNLMSTLGGLYYDSGQESSADSIWHAVISIDPHNMQLYRLVANEMMEHRLYDQCIRLYTAGRTMSKSETMFADELGSLYSAIQQYTSAVKEYTQLVKKSPDQLLFAQSRLSTFTSKPEALRATSKVISAETAASPDNIALHRLYAWLLMEDKHYDLALEQYRIIDKLGKANGNELFNFAQRLSQERAFRTAIEALKEVIDQYKNPQLIPYAQYEYARALERLSEETDVVETVLDSSSVAPEPESLPNYRQAIRLYETIVDKNPNPDLVAQSFLRIGIIKYEKLFDLNGAFDALSRIKNLPQTSNISCEATIVIGLIQETRNDLTAAQKTFMSLNGIPLNVYRNQAIFKLAELDYYNAQFDSSLSKLKYFDINLKSDLANDALQLQYFIQENRTTAPQALMEFAKADLLIRQRKYSESLAQFQDIIKRYPTALLVDDALIKIGDLHLRLKQVSEALVVFHFLADSMQSSTLQDRAEFLVGEVYQKIQHNNNAAIEAYEKLLARYPYSLYAEEARKRIRFLRGDIL